MYALTLCFPLFSQGAATEAPHPLTRTLQKFVDDKTVAGAVGLVAVNGRILYSEAVGFKELENERAMQLQSLFWIASMTKPITAAAIMTLQEDGKLSIEDPVEKHLPEFKNQWLLAKQDGNTRTLKRPVRPITIRDLLTHTSGLGDISQPRANSTLPELVMAYSQLPLKFEPGSKWEYCNSGINTLGRIVEVLSGRQFDIYLHEEFFRPLGMKDTTFYPDLRQLRRLAVSYTPKTNGAGLDPVQIFIFQNNMQSSDRFPMPAGGLFSTAQDMLKFYQMMLNKGSFEGTRYLKPESVALMTATQTGELKTGFTDGMSFGLGFAVVKTPVGITEKLSAGTFGHGGAYGTQSWADPEKNAVFILMIQRANLKNADASPVREAFQAEAVKLLGGK